MSFHSLQRGATHTRSKVTVSEWSLHIVVLLATQRHWNCTPMHGHCARMMCLRMSLSSCCTAGHARTQITMCDCCICLHTWAHPLSKRAQKCEPALSVAPSTCASGTVARARIRSITTCATWASCQWHVFAFLCVARCPAAGHAHVHSLGFLCAF